MTLIFKIDLDTKNEVSLLRHSKVTAQTNTQTDRQTHRQYENITLRHTQAVKIWDYQMITGP